jgi:hypothetical protein
MMVVLMGAYFSSLEANTVLIVPTSAPRLARSSIFKDRVGKPERAFRTAKWPGRHQTDFALDVKVCLDGAQAAILSYGSSGYYEPI